MCFMKVIYEKEIERVKDRERKKRTDSVTVNSFYIYIYMVSEDMILF